MSKPPKTPPAPAAKPTIKSIAAALGVTPRRVSQLRQAGMPCESIAAAEAWRKREDLGNSDFSPERLRASRIKLLDLQAARQQLEHDKETGLLVTAASVLEDTLAVCQAVKTAFLRLTNDLPPKLEGRTPAQICRVLRESFNSCLDGLHRGIYFATPRHREAARLLCEEEKKFNR